MTAITIGFEVHQPFRVREDFYWNNRQFSRVKGGFEGLFNHYFSENNKEIFQRVAQKCYYPANNLILKLLDEHKDGKRAFKCSFSLSGIFLEGCQRFEPDLVESFRELASNKRVEFLDQTYHHSLFSLYDDMGFFIDDVKEHKALMKDLLGVEPHVFENTEFLYNNRIAGVVEDMGYKGIFTEGLERITNGASPNHVYKAKDGNIRVLLRNYQLTDDVGFRFSARDWEEHPLTAEKYAAWLSSTQGDCINIFMDYETLGEHHWPETGILNFLEHFPGEVLKWEHLDFATPSEVIERYEPVGVVDAYELGGTVSWADLERDTSCWLGNSMQWAAFTYHRQLGPRVLDKHMKRIWGYLAASDHLYYMFTAGGAPGEVHSYFSPFENPNNAFLNYLAVLFDFDSRITGKIKAASHPFVFTKEDGTVVGVAHGKKDFANMVKQIDPGVLKHHLKRRDFENWARGSLKDEGLAGEIGRIKNKKVIDEGLRAVLADVFSKK